MIQSVAPRTETLPADVVGIVVVEAIVDSDGAVCSAAVQKSLTPDADRIAIEAVKQWRFAPAKLDGEPWPVAFNVTVKID